MPRRILVVDDDPRIRESLARVLASEHTTVRAADSAEEALAILGELRPELVISDIRMPGLDGLALLRLLKERAPDVDVALMTAYDDLPTVAAAMREGAADFLVKPLDLHQLRTVVERIFADRRARAHRAAGPAAATGAGEGSDEAAPRLIGHDPRMVEIFKLVGQLAATRTSVIIRGESGTGKELIARAIHDTSPAASEPFVAVNCTALPVTLLESELFGHVRGSFTGATADRRGRFALAGRGTIFLDEIGDTTPEFQGKLLRVLQEQEYYPVGAERAERTQARVMAATHRDLEGLIARGEFREDLYYRLRVVEIRVPPLRERRGDIPELAEHLMSKAARAAGRPPPLLAPEALELLLAHAWPGNVRELENCLTRAVVLATGNVIRREHLAIGMPAAPARLASLDEVEAAHVAQVLRAVGGNRTRAAEVLGVSRPRLRRLIERHGLSEQNT
ncbi:MAG: sigma-54-dependent Fis family transcriptional regulator [Gemmatimonadetes bacterium]|nr:sigma-54-dependent Fis family transcriptional regulator [Gemmatimonadota bacterium]